MLTYKGVEYTPQELSRILPSGWVQYILKKRERTPYPSVTELNKGAMLMYLENKHRDEIVIDVEDQVYQLFGHMAHEVLEYRDERNISECRLTWPGIVSGAFDLATIGEDGHVTLWDFKTSGSYKVKRFLGYVTVEEPVLDEDGNEVLLKSGPNKGKPKMQKVQKQGEPQWEDIADYTMQLNAYSYLLTEKLSSLAHKLQGAPSEIASDYIVAGDRESLSTLQYWAEIWDGQEPDMKIMFVPRDGGFKAVTNHDMNEKIYVVDIQNLPRKDKLEFILSKSAERVKAIAGEEPEAGCDKLESWNGRRCEGYCPVAQFCTKKYGG